MYILLRHSLTSPAINHNQFFHYNQRELVIRILLQLEFSYVVANEELNVFHRFICMHSSSERLRKHFIEWKICFHHSFANWARLGMRPCVINFVAHTWKLLSCAMQFLYFASAI